MKTLKLAILFLTILASSNNFAQSPHESDSLVQNEITAGKIIAAESSFLNNELIRLTIKLDKTLSTLPAVLDHQEGKIIAVLVQQIEGDLENVKKDVEALSYQNSSDSIHGKLEQIEQDIDMI